MAGGWRISNADELIALRRARVEARTQRTEESWNRLAACVARCEQLGLLDDDTDADVDRSDERGAASARNDSAPGTNPPRYATAD